MAEGEERGKPVQILRTKNGNAFELNEKELERILLAEDVKDKPVVIVSVAGAFRKGKSFLLDFFLRYMQSGDKNDWLGDPTAPLRGFTWRGGCDGDTTGILLWDEVFLVTSPEEEQLAVLLMDTQGTFDCKSTVQSCATIFALSTMTSSVQVYNLSQNIQEDDLQYLEYFTEYGRLAQEVQQGSGRKPFQKLLFLVRDWCYPYEADYGAEGGEQFLQKRLEISEEQAQELQSLRLRIKSCFLEIGCFLMPHPGLMVATEESFDGRLSDIDEKFKLQLQDLVPSLLAAEKLLVKEVNGQKITCKMLMDYFKAYVKIFRSDELPKPKSAWQTTAEVNNLQAMAAAKDSYMSEMEKLCGAEQPYLSPEKLATHHAQHKLSAIELFSRTPKMGGADFSKTYLDRLETGLEYAFRALAARNDQKTSLRTKVVLTAIMLGSTIATGGFALAGLFDVALGFAGLTTVTQVMAHARDNISSSGRFRRLRSCIDGVTNSVWDGVALGTRRASRRAPDVTVPADEETQPLLRKEHWCTDD